MRMFGWTMSGIDGNGNRWETAGNKEVDDNTVFPEVLDLIQRESFRQLTNGLAVYGKPGIGCCGPYRITGMTVVDSYGELEWD